MRGSVLLSLCFGIVGTGTVQVSTHQTLELDHQGEHRLYDAYSIEGGDREVHLDKEARAEPSQRRRHRGWDSRAGSSVRRGYRSTDRGRVIYVDDNDDDDGVVDENDVWEDNGDGHHRLETIADSRTNYNRRSAEPAERYAHGHEHKWKAASKTREDHIPEYVHQLENGAEGKYQTISTKHHHHRLPSSYLQRTHHHHHHKDRVDENVGSAGQDDVDDKDNGEDYGDDSGGVDENHSKKDMGERALTMETTTAEDADNLNEQSDQRFRQHRRHRRVTRDDRMARLGEYTPQDQHKHRHHHTNGVPHSNNLSVKGRHGGGSHQHRRSREGDDEEYDTSSTARRHRNNADDGGGGNSEYNSGNSEYNNDKRHPRGRRNYHSGYRADDDDDDDNDFDAEDWDEDNSNNNNNNNDKDDEPYSRGENVDAERVLVSNQDSIGSVHRHVKPKKRKNHHHQYVLQIDDDADSDDANTLYSRRQYGYATKSPQTLLEPHQRVSYDHAVPLGQVGTPSRPHRHVYSYDDDGRELQRDEQGNFEAMTETDEEMVKPGAFEKGGAVEKGEDFTERLSVPLFSMLNLFFFVCGAALMTIFSCCFFYNKFVKQNMASR